ncbi:hypothetical protein KP79_PYT14034 [Mizuhopecten yessoensis]|uniref:Uncharacterized protein n=1 Tax=Mizuhopecten yessoensis TaxID=6573 RepID=A0A210PZ81_MIZYE|nr:hypothetical protein KP79_PYT14034 [Mizuhopecten yessoensis]
MEPDTVKQEPDFSIQPLQDGENLPTICLKEAKYKGNTVDIQPSSQKSECLDIHVYRNMEYGAMKYQESFRETPDKDEPASALFTSKKEGPDAAAETEMKKT